MPEPSSQIFVSYARIDSDFVDRIEADLRTRGRQTWVDRSQLVGGDEWPSYIEREIVRSSCMIVVLSPEAIMSKWVRREITLADNLNMLIIPLLLRPVIQLPLQIAARQYIDFTKDYDQGIQKLLRAIPTPPSPPPTREDLFNPKVPIHQQMPLLASQQRNPLEALLADNVSVFLQHRSSWFQRNIHQPQPILLQRPRKGRIEKIVTCTLCGSQRKMVLRSKQDAQEALGRVPLYYVEFLVLFFAVGANLTYSNWPLALVFLLGGMFIAIFMWNRSAFLARFWPRYVALRWLMPMDITAQWRGAQGHQITTQDGTPIDNYVNVFSRNYRAYKAWEEVIPHPFR